jgi:hypothetical protein
MQDNGLLAHWFTTTSKASRAQQWRLRPILVATVTHPNTRPSSCFFAASIEMRLQQLPTFSQPVRLYIHPRLSPMTVIAYHK